MGFMAFVSKVGFKIKKASPTLFFIGGVAAVGAGTVLMVKATKKAETIIDNFNDEKDVYIKTTEDSEETQQKVIAGMKKDATWCVVKTYAAPVGLEVLGLASFGASFGILEKRSAIALGVAEVASSKLNLVKERAKEMLEPEKARELLSGIVSDPDLPPFDTVDKDGNTLTVPGRRVDEAYSPYAIFFDELSDQWRDDPAENMRFLNGLENRAYVYLQRHGHLFLNKVREWAGLEDNSIGALDGWIYDPARGREQIDLGINHVWREAVRDFQNGYESSIILEPNVQGPIWNLI